MEHRPPRSVAFIAKYILRRVGENPDQAISGGQWWRCRLSAALAQESEPQKGGWQEGTFGISVRKVGGNCTSNSPSIISHSAAPPRVSRSR